MYKHLFKRLIDIVLSLIGIVVLALPMLIVAVIIKIDSPGPVFFRQKRIGYKGRVFEIIKYRTMCVGAEQMGTGVYSGNGDTRVTKVGKFLRKTSFDEVPQLFNTLSGSMSFIGPRPRLHITYGRSKNTLPSNAGCLMSVPELPVGHRYTDARRWSGIIVLN